MGRSVARLTGQLPAAAMRGRGRWSFYGDDGDFDGVTFNPVDHILKQAKRSRRRERRITRQLRMGNDGYRAENARIERRRQRCQQRWRANIARLRLLEQERRWSELPAQLDRIREDIRESGDNEYEPLPEWSELTSPV